MASSLGGKIRTSVDDRVEATVALIERRGYAVPAHRLAELCLGGRALEAEVLAAVAGSPSLQLAHGLVMGPRLLPATAARTSASRARPPRQSSASRWAGTA